MASQILNGIDSSEKVAILDAGAQYGKVGGLQFLLADSLLNMPLTKTEIIGIFCSWSKNLELSSEGRNRTCDLPHRPVLLPLF